MPSLVIPHRRRREYDSDGESDRISSATTTPSVNKRARLQVNGEDSLSQSPLFPDGYLSQPNGSLQHGHAEEVSMEHQPGSIVRVKLRNFVTYTSVEFFPGPNLNMVIGPNGTGKSTLVCAICLGLGWGTQHLGRAKEVSDFVKHGCEDATIEIELAGKKAKRNPVFQCNIKREGSKCTFAINGKPATKKEVQKLAMSFAIQIDNLCQFLPQDKVVEFAGMTPVELLRSTMRAVASQEMIDAHDKLKKWRAQQQTVQDTNANQVETLNSLEGRQRMQEADVQRMREREQIKEQVRMLETLRPFARYRAVRKLYEQARTRRKEAETELKSLKEAIEPSLRAVNAKQAYRDLIERVVHERRANIERAERKADGYTKRVNELSTLMEDCRKEVDAERKGNKTNKADSTRLEGIIARLRKQMEEEPVQFDVADTNEKIRAKQRAQQELISQASELQHNMAELREKGLEFNNRIERARQELANLDSQAGQQNHKLTGTSRDSAKAWEWVQKNQDKFEQRVFGPPIVECSVKDVRYVDMIESSFNSNDFICFTVQTRGDFKKLQRQLHHEMGLSQITIRTMTGGLQNFPPPISEEECKRYGFDGFALDFMSGPEPVLAMLCSEGPRLNQTAVALKDTSDEQYRLLEDSVMQSWITRKSIYRINRRREYGAGAVSTQVRDVKKALVWTDQPVNMSAKQALQDDIQGWHEEVKTIQDVIGKKKEQVAQLKTEKAEIAAAEQELVRDKEAKQRALASFKLLPIKLAQQEEKLVDVQRNMEGVRERILAVNANYDKHALERGQVALGYAGAVVDLKESHLQLREVEVMFIEANSDFEVLGERNREVKEQLEAKQREQVDLENAAKAAQNDAKAAITECSKIMETADPALSEFLRDKSAEGNTLSEEELETEIESEKARLELMHEGNGDVIREYEKRQNQIDRMKASLEEYKHALEEFDAKINEVRKDWEPKLDELVESISSSFGHNMAQIRCAGEVSIYKDEEDFDKWCIQIKVKFRDHEPLTQLDSHRQSGGERAVSTIFYLMSLQALTRSPFRVVDEINQGMDPRNERLVHARMVSIATGNDDNPQTRQTARAAQPNGEASDNEQDTATTNGDVARVRTPGSQYFLITPKLLHNLKYEPGMRVLCIASGEYMPENQSSIDFQACVDIRRGIAASA